MNASTCSRLLAILVCATLLALPARSHAGTTWDGGGGDDNWTTGGNWNDDLAPGTGVGPLVFAGSTRLTPTNDYSAGSPFNGITFNSGAGAFTLGGNGITLGGNVTNNSTSLQTIGFGLTTTTPRTFAATSGDLELAGGIDGVGGGITKNGANTLTISGPINYSGLTRVDAGSLVLAAGASGAIGELQNSGGSQIEIDIGTATIQTGKLLVGNAGSGAVELTSGTLTVTAGNSEIGRTTNGNGTLTLNSNASFQARTIVGSGGNARGQVVVGSDADVSFSQLYIGQTGSDNTFDWESTGTLTVVNLWVGNAGTGTLTMSSGTATISGSSNRIGRSSGSNATLAIEGGSFDYTTNVIMGETSGTGTINLSGGTLSFSGGNLTRSGAGFVNVSGGLLDMRGRALPNLTDFTFTGGRIEDATQINNPLVQDATAANSVLALVDSNLLLNQDYTAQVSSGENTATVDVGAGRTLTLATSRSLTIGSGGILAGSGTVTGGLGVGLTAGGGLAPGGSGVGQLSLGSGLDLSGISGGGNLRFQLGSADSPGFTYDQVSLAGQTLSIGTLDFADFAFSTIAGFGAGSYTLFAADSITGSLGEAEGTVNGLAASLSIDGGNLLLTTAVPEPGTLALAAIAAVAGVGLLRRRR